MSANHGLFVPERSREDDDAVGESAAAIVARLDDRLGEVTHSLQQFMV